MGDGDGDGGGGGIVRGALNSAQDRVERDLCRHAGFERARALYWTQCRFCSHRLNLVILLFTNSNNRLMFSSPDRMI